MGLNFRLRTRYLLEQEESIVHSGIEQSSMISRLCLSEDERREMRSQSERLNGRIRVVRRPFAKVYLALVRLEVVWHRGE